ncbi:flagellar hook-associated protein 3 [Oxalobacteraceae bacterium OM1]|nr:flagellar hook-associated protein 3 [Oxalobacteraceae bacterium OM1]
MRISTSSLYQTSLARLNDLQAKLAKVQEQLSTNRRIVSPSDDPVAASRALDLSQSKAVNARLGQNRGDARAALQIEESTLAGVTSLYQDIKTSIVQAGNGALDNTQRQFIATDLKNKLADLIGKANSRDGEGNYLFAGFQNTAQPFNQSGATVQYAGDQGVRMLQVGQARQMAINDTGHALFVDVPATNATRAIPAPTNAGTGTIGTPQVLDSTKLTGHTYAIDIGGGGTTYAVYDITADPTKTTSVASGTYSSGAPIQFDGMQVAVTGAVANNDSFTLQPAPTQDVFATMQNLIDALGKPVSTDADKTMLQYNLTTANDNIDKALDNVLTVRASVGSRLKELDSLDSTGDDLDLQYESAIESLTGLDMAKAITELTLQKTSLEAAQQSFVKISNLSLFNYIS